MEWIARDARSSVNVGFSQLDWLYYANLQEVVKRGIALRGDGVEGFEFAEFSKGPEQPEINLPSVRHIGTSVLVVGTLLIFTAAFPISHWRILCHPGAVLGS